MADQILNGLVCAESVKNTDTGEVPVLKNTLGPVSTAEHSDIG